jgi:hypothetical protein
MDAVESSLRFGIVAGGLYQTSAAATASTTGSAASATTAGTVSAGAAGLSTAGIVGLSALGAVAVGGAAAAGGSSDGSTSDPVEQNSQVTEQTLVGNWYVTERSRTDWYMDATLYKDGRMNATEYSGDLTMSGSGSWSYNYSTKYFSANFDGGGGFAGNISGSMNDFYVSGRWANGEPAYFHFVRR